MQSLEVSQVLGEEGSVLGGYCSKVALDGKVLHGRFHDRLELWVTERAQARYQV